MVKKIASDGCLGVQELRPGDLRSFWGWVDPPGFENAPHRGRSDVVAEACEFAVDASVAPGRVLGGEAEDELADLGCGRRASRSSRGLCPVTSDAPSVPAQQCFRCDDPTASFGAGERGCDHAEQSPVLIAEGGSCGLAA
jgi:hypothetical protein